MKIFDDHKSQLLNALNSVNQDQVDRLIQLLKSYKTSRRNVFVIGNGGSAATAAHFANDLITLGISARALTDPSTITCIGNDFSYEEIFSRQIKNHCQLADIVIAFTASGNSPNIIEAFKTAFNYGANCWAFTGFDGGKIADMIDYVNLIHVPTNPKEYGVAEDAHMVICHIISKAIVQSV